MAEKQGDGSKKETEATELWVHISGEQHAQLPAQFVNVSPALSGTRLNSLPVLHSELRSERPNAVWDCAPSSKTVGFNSEYFTHASKRVISSRSLC